MPEASEASISKFFSGLLVDATSYKETSGANDLFLSEQIGGLVMSDYTLFIRNAAAIAAFAAQHRLPSIGPPELPASGGLMGYGVNFIEIFRRAAYFVDKILKGAKPGDIPIELPTRFKLVLNLKTAKALGLTIPDKLLSIADDVIE